jgi:hypothetical protein
MAFYRGPNIVTNGLVLSLDAANTKSYPGSGTAWSDLSGNGNNGTLTNGPTFNSANGGSIVFDGVDDYFIRTDSTLKNYTNITATIWMSNSSANSFEPYFNYNANFAFLNAGWGVRRQSTGNIFQYWGGNGNTGIKLYRNGVLIGTSSAAFALANADIGNFWQMVTLVATGVSSWEVNNRLTIAIRSDFENFNNISSMRSALFSLYNRELTASEIQQNYNAQKARFGL